MRQLIYKGEKNKDLLIMRGVSGSGKTTYAKTLSKYVYSTDDYFTKDGKYSFCIEKANIAHDWNRNRVKDALEKGLSPVVVDNANICAWEIKPYLEMGLLEGYNVYLAEPDTDFKFDLEELVKKSAHNVPRKYLKLMLDGYETNLTVEKILNSKKYFYANNPFGITEKNYTVKDYSFCNKINPNIKKEDFEKNKVIILWKGNKRAGYYLQGIEIFVSKNFHGKGIENYFFKKETNNN
ncbi:MAG: hypothetical protein PHH82_01615 [Candidatus ainarchaeum sp.]|nr:hypothetical protein [Candidatus ainarchaeum sp.]